MTHVYFDASALAKRYVPEPGSPEVNHVFARVPPDRVRVLAVGAGEVVSVLLRYRNAGRLSAGLYTRAGGDFRAEILDHPAVVKVETDTGTVRRSFPLLEVHNLNATDAVVLRTALDLKAAVAPAGGDVLLTASDRRLTAAAAAEGLPTFDPERQPAADFDAAYTP